MRPDTFLKTLINSLANPKYYIDVLNVRFWFSVRFLVMGYLFVTCVAAAIFTVIDLPKLQQSFTSYLESSVESFPEDRQITWTGLKVESTPEETYTLPFPILPDAAEVPRYLLQLNSSVRSAEEIGQHSKGSSFFFVGQHALFVSQPSGGWSDLSLHELLDTSAFTIDKQSLVSSLPQLRNQLRWLLGVLPVAFAFFFFFISFPLRVIGVALDTIIIFVIVKLFGMPLNFKKVIQISFHVMVIAELINVLTANVSRALPMFLFAFWGYTIFIYWQLRHVKAFSIDEVEGQGKD